MKIPRSLRISVRQEKSVAKALPAARRVAGSGNVPGFRGDVKNAEFLVEAKVTESQSYRLNLDGPNGWLAIERKARQAGKEPVMVVDLAGRRLAVVDANYVEWQDAEPTNVVSKGYRLTPAEWRKLETEAWAEKREPRLLLAFPGAYLAVIAFDFLRSLQRVSNNPAGA